jgi:hypothetical protein
VDGATSFWSLDLAILGQRQERNHVVASRSNCPLTWPRHTTATPRHCSLQTVSTPERATTPAVADGISLVKMVKVEVCRRSAVLVRMDRYRANRRTQVRCGHASVAQWIEHRFPKPCVAGSIPARGATKHLVDRLQLATIDPKTPFG